jgi:putative two-component system response regulator
MPGHQRTLIPDPAGCRILVVDDEPANVLLLTRILNRAGYRDVISAPEPFRVPDMIAAARPDILLLDLRMPGMSGLELLEILRLRIPADEFMPVVVLTADDSAASRQRALSLGASDFLTKPLDGIEVVLRIGNLLRIRMLHGALRERNRTLEFRVRERTQALEAAQMEVLERLAQAAELHDDDTGSHTRRVGLAAARLGERLGLAPGEVSRLERTAPLHDVGKIGMPDSILRKPGPLSPAEREEMERHAEIGARLLSGGSTEHVRMAEEIARSHHERWDGRGYPAGLSGESIPLSARIVSVVDVFDALAHDRPTVRRCPPRVRPPWSRRARVRSSIPGSSAPSCRGWGGADGAARVGRHSGVPWSDHDPVGIGASARPGESPPSAGRPGRNRRRPRRNRPSFKL